MHKETRFTVWPLVSSERLFSSIALSIVGSAVNTVIVLFCEAPAEFQNNHPQLSNDMRAAWTGAWPELNIN